MADLSKIKLNNTTYNLKDAQARTIFEVDGILEGDGEGNISAASITATSTLNIDSAPAEDSDNLVTSGGVWAAIQNAGGGGIETETDPFFTASPAAGITQNDINSWDAKVSDDKTWNGVTLDKTGTISSSSMYLAARASTDATTAYQIQATSTPSSQKIAMYNSNLYLSSTTPSANDNSTKVATTAYVDGAISNLGSVLTYKGTKTAISNLPTTGNATGDVWHITADSSEYAWDGSSWQELGTAVDLSGYVPTSRTVNGKALSSDITLSASDVSAAASSHTHGNITNGGDITATAPTVANGDQIIINDHSASKITNGPTFDGSTTTKYLSQKGTWESLPTDNDNRDPGYGQIKAGTASTSTSAITANTSTAQASTYNELLTINPGNKWVSVAASNSSTSGSDTFTIGHSAGLTAKTSYGSTATTASANGGTITVTDVKYDEAGHITGSTDRTITLSQTTYTVGNKALKIASNTGTATQAITVNENSSDRTLTIKGDGTYLSGSVSGSANAVTVAITPSDSGATAGSYGDSANQTPGYGSTFKVPYITVDAKGRVTGISEHTVQIPASDNTNTDTLVKQTSKTDSVEYKILMGSNSSPTSGTAYEAVYDANITINPSTHTITATNFAGNASSATKLGNTTVGGSTQPIYLSNGTATTCSTYAGGTAVTLNGTSKAASTASFYAPTSAGTSGYYLKSNGSGAPSWTSFPTIPTITLNGSSTTSPSFYAPTGAGTSGQILQSNGSGAPSWANMPDTSAFKAYKATNSVELPVLLISGSASQTTTNPSISTSVSAYGAIPNSNAPTVNSSTGALTVNSTTNLKEKIILRKSYNYDTVMPTETSATTGQLFFTSEGVGGGVSSISQTLDKIYMVGIKSESDDTLYYNENVYAQNNVLYGAAWNDYAEYRESFEIEPGRVIIELGNGRLIRSTDRLQPGAEIISDTYGFIIGKGNPRCSTPVAVCGRVLAYTYEDRHLFGAGDAVCSGPDGTVSKMTREEIKEYPERIIGTVSEVPEYETWGTGNIKVNNRIWIRLR